MRQEFSKRTKLLAWDRSGGRCEICSAKLFAGNTEFHHQLECAFGGTDDMANIIVACRACHSAITKKRAAVIAKSNRVRAAHIGIKRKSGRPMPGSRASGFKRKMNGTVERRT